MTFSFFFGEQSKENIREKYVRFQAVGATFLSLYLAPPQPDPAPAYAWDPIPLRAWLFLPKKSSEVLAHSLRATYQAGAQGLKRRRLRRTRRNGVFDSRRGEPGFQSSQDPLSRVESASSWLQGVERTSRGAARALQRGSWTEPGSKCRD